MNDTKITIREATLEDTESIVRFQEGMALETEGKVLDEALLRDGITAIFDSTQKGFYIVAEMGSVVVGSLLITYEWSDWRNATFWWIQSVFVDANWRRKGVYRSMYEYVVNVAKSRKDICGIRLYVERTNTIAQETYKDLGMTHSHYDLYETDIVL
tara:strand:+ start:12157 stop:12624 length:468 start_codon:yes stop_codon:yes gene_type:complete